MRYSVPGLDSRALPILMEQEHVTLHCQCGQKIQYIQSWQAGFKFNDYAILVCAKCKAEFNINKRDQISELVGAVEKVSRF